MLKCDYTTRHKSYIHSDCLSAINKEYWGEEHNQFLALRQYYHLIVEAERREDNDITLVLTEQKWDTDEDELIDEIVIHSYTNYKSIVFIDDEEKLCDEYYTKLKEKERDKNGDAY